MLIKRYLPNKKISFLIQMICFFAIIFLNNNSFARGITKEDKIKASYVFNSIRFISWPPNALERLASLNVCTISQNNAFKNAFKPVVGKKIKGHILKFYQVKVGENIDRCHVLFLDKTAAKKIKILRDILLQKQILFISDIKDFCEQGGMIGLKLQDGRIKLEINLSAVKLVGFEISSNLLEVATIIGEH
jgi:hypothetical protein